MAHRSKTTRTVILGAALASGIAFAGTQARAADDGYDNVFSSVLTATGLLHEKTSPDIEYRERPPLVLPPKAGLVAPVKQGAARPSSWPQDPDVLKQRKAAEAARAPMLDGFANSRDGVLSKEELMRGRVAGGQGGGPDECGGFANNNRSCNLLSPDELKAQGDRYNAMVGADKKSDVVTAGVEPDRVYLTQPPRGYLKATKTVKVTAEAPREIVDESNPKAANYYRAPTNE
ncbi:hypothetical protein [Lichenihabitans psoromatis]|uniref:hypothetical protein n=1 Tax=Lichenihabitans psoromatis TaxID=2528642 RepID=UPI001038375F|nr:hypothetical protein [Lichenihabitans psoromatis]